MCEELNVPFLGSLPLDPTVARYCDEGKDFISELPNSPVVQALGEIVKSKLGSRGGNNLTFLIFVCFFRARYGVRIKGRIIISTNGLAISEM